MATPKRPAKSSKSWTFKDLNAYNVRIKTVDTEAFFGNSDLPSPSVDSIILQSVNISPDLDVPQDIQTFFDYLHNSTWPANEDRPLFMDEFTQHLLSSVMQFGFTRIRASFPFIMSGQRVKATASISTSTPTRGDSRIRHQIILGQRNRVSRDRAEPRLVATALGAFSVDNERRTANGLAPMASKRYIGIITIGSAPFFYKITGTQDLVDAVMNSQFPTQETIIERFIPVPNVDDFLRDGMVPLDNRQACLQCYEALKTLL